MEVPGLVESTLDGEEVVASVALKGDDVLFLAPSRTLVYRGNSLLSDESVEEFPHDAERVTVSEGRRKATVTLDYGLDGERTLTVPGNALDEVVHTVLAGVFNAAGVTDEGETITRTYRFSELTLVVTSDRVVKHVGNAVWTEDYEEIHYGDVTGLDVEEGSVATQLVLETHDRPQRIKTPSDQSRDVREHVEEALLEYHGAPSLAAFERQVAAEADPDPEASAAESADSESETHATQFESPGLDPIETSGADDVPHDDGIGGRSDAGRSGGGGVGRRTDETAEDADRTAAERGQVADDGADGGRTGAENPDDGFENSAFETAVDSGGAPADHEELAEQLRALDEAMARQEDLLAEQRALLEELARELSPDR